MINMSCSHSGCQESASQMKRQGKAIKFLIKLFYGRYDGFGTRILKSNRFINLKHK